MNELSEEEFFVSESRVMQIVRKMIQSGATVDGKHIERPLFTGFKVLGKPSVQGRAVAKVSLPKAQPYVERQLSLFPE